jgi:hypothetical protein
VGRERSDLSSILYAIKFQYSTISPRASLRRILGFNEARDAVYPLSEAAILRARVARGTENGSLSFFEEVEEWQGWKRVLLVQVKGG